MCRFDDTSAKKCKQLLLPLRFQFLMIPANGYLSTLISHHPAYTRNILSLFHITPLSRPNFFPIPLYHTNLHSNSHSHYHNSFPPTPFHPTLTSRLLLPLRFIFLSSRFIFPYFASPHSQSFFHLPQSFSPHSSSFSYQQYPCAPIPLPPTPTTKILPSFHFIYLLIRLVSTCSISPYSHDTTSSHIPFNFPTTKTHFPLFHFTLP